MSETILVTLADGPVDAGTPLLFADDLAAVRGDGIFETLLVRAGRACGVDSHLDRLTRSAAMLDLPQPDRAAFAGAIETAAGLWAQRHGGDTEGLLRVVYSRGREAHPANDATPELATAYVTVSALPSRAVAARADGVAVVTLPRGYSVDLAASAPWALLGAKTLSYATNMAALRHAARLGYDDVIYTSNEGEVLEGPRSSVVAVFGRTLVTPPAEVGILPGTTVRQVFETAESRDWQTKSESLFPEDLIAADAVWLVSSVTLAAPVRRLNDYRFVPAAPESEDEFRALVDEAIGAAPAD